jgi:hypothetical protein
MRNSDDFRATHGRNESDLEWLAKNIVISEE